MALDKITGIVIDIRKHSDRHNIVTLFCREQGRVSVLSPAGNGKSARLRNASLMPLSVIRSEINFKSSRSLQFLGKFQREYAWKDIYFNPVKSAIALFITEFVNTYTRYSGPDSHLWDFLIYALRRLDDTKGNPANYHLGFLMDFSYFAGIRPDLSEWREDALFDMRAGSMTIFTPTHRDFLDLKQSSFLPLLMRLNLRTASKFKFNGERRRELLKMMLHYYSLHFPGLDSLKSPEILTEIFK